MRRALLGVVLLLAGCTSDPAEPEQREVVVLAASSLTEVLTGLAASYEDSHPGVEVVLSFGASSALAQQVASGAPADLFAAASPAAMQVVLDAGQARGEPRVLARNRLEIAVPPGNPGSVRGLADLARPELDVALCAAQVPCGAAAVRVFAAAGLEPAADTLEQDVKAVLAKVRLREVDAGLVYVTDVQAAGADVEGVPFPEAAKAVSDYPAVVLRGGENAGAAQELLDLLASPEGREAFTAAGFS